MLQITISMDPTFAELGPLKLTWHGLFSALAVIVAVAVTRRELLARQVPLPRFDATVFWTVIGGTLGARLFFFFDHPRLLLDDPLEFFAFTDGGLAIYGAVIGGFVAVAVLSRVYTFSFRRVIDCIAPGLLLAQAIGRIGCAINGDAWGGPTSSPFAFVYTHPDALIPNRLLGVPTHPYPVYDMAVDLALLALIWRLRRRPLPAGALFAIYALLYALTRAVISVVREERVWFWGLQQAQVISLVIAALAAGALTWLLRSGAPADRSHRIVSVQQGVDYPRG
jgi:phosphatidylglycerol:prolipoprotein diacylglycerol transferase